MHLDGSLVQIVSVRWVSGHDVHQIEPYSTGIGSRAGRFEQWGGVQGPHVSLIKRARTMAGLIVGAVVLGISLRGLSSR
mgnify:FL=1